MFSYLQMRRYNELFRSEIVIVLLYDGGFVYSNHGCIYTVVGKEQEMSNRNAHLPGGAWSTTIHPVSNNGSNNATFKRWKKRLVT